MLSLNISNWQAKLHTSRFHNYQENSPRGTDSYRQLKPKMLQTLLYESTKKKQIEIQKLDILVIQILSYLRRN